MLDDAEVYEFRAQEARASPGDSNPLAEIIASDREVGLAILCGFPRVAANDAEGSALGIGAELREALAFRIGELFEPRAFQTVPKVGEVVQMLSLIRIGRDGFFGELRPCQLLGDGTRELVEGRAHEALQFLATRSCLGEPKEWGYILQSLARFAGCDTLDAEIFGKAFALMAQEDKHGEPVTLSEYSARAGAGKLTFAEMTKKTRFMFRRMAEWLFETEACDKPQHTSSTQPRGCWRMF